MKLTNVLVLGGGGREDALVQWIRRCCYGGGKIFVTPGNAGMIGFAKFALCDKRPIQLDDFDGLVAFCRRKRIDLVVVGPEAPLVAGIADRLRAEGIGVFGPSAAAARIEGSKSFARELLREAGVPQPEFSSFEDANEAIAYLRRQYPNGICVIKADGLAAGKGVKVCNTYEQAKTAIISMLVDGVFKEAGKSILVEEQLDGPEVSLHVITDGENIVPLLPAQDYKRACDGDLGENTGGMGSYAPVPFMTPKLVGKAIDTIIEPTLSMMRKKGFPFQGCFYAGLMLTNDGLKLIEFNCRFGDPETQAILPLMKSDLLELLRRASTPGGLAGYKGVEWYLRENCVCVILTSNGYPGKYETGYEITGLEEAKAAVSGRIIFHSGTAIKDGKLVTAGGRVLAISGIGNTLNQAANRAYRVARYIKFEGCTYRSDIGRKVLEN